MFKKAAIIIALLGVLGSGQTEWLDTGLAAARKISGAVPEDLTELLSSVVRQKQPERRKSISKQAYTGRVSSVSDGDTLHVTDSDGLKHKIRLAYIDAPELQQAYGTRSHQNLKRAADGENVNVTVFELDRYGREVAQVRMDGEDLNLMQIRDGAAWHYNAYAAKKQKKTDYAAYAAPRKMRGRAATDYGTGFTRRRRGTTVGNSAKCRTGRAAVGKNSRIKSGSTFGRQGYAAVCFQG